MDPQVKGQQTLSGKGQIVNILGFVGLKYLGFSGLEAKLRQNYVHPYIIREKRNFHKNFFLMKIKI